MAKPYKRGNIWWIGITVKGVQKCISLNTRNYKEALQRAKDLEQRHKGIRLSELLNSWLEKNDDKSQRYRNDAVVSMNQFIGWFGDKSAGYVTRHDIEEYYKNYLKKKADNKKAYANNTCGIRLRTLKRILNFGYENDHIPHQPFRGFKIPSPEAKGEFLDETEVDKLLEVSGEDNPLYQAYIEFLLYTGCRMGEFIGLKYGDIDKRFIKFKGKSGERKLPITDQIRGTIKKIMILQFENVNNVRMFDDFVGAGKTLEDPKLVRPWENKNNYHLIDSKGNYIGKWNTFGKIIKRYMKKAKLPKSYTAHTLRHTFASHLVLNGEPIEKVSKLLGHKSIKTTETFYVHLRPESMDFKLPY